MSKTVAILATLDTKAEEAAYLRDRITGLGGRALVVDIGVVGEPSQTGDVTRKEVAEAGGADWEDFISAPTRETAGPVMVAGATKLLLDRLGRDEVHGVIGLGGTQGTSSCSQVMQAMPYGFPKVMVSTAASGDVSSFVGIKDITMMFSVSDLLGLNSLTKKILANAAAAVYGMASVDVAFETGSDGGPLIAMTNLGVLTDGATLAMELFREAGYEVVVFHAVGSGGQAMEQLMKEGVVSAVFDYAMGEIADDVFGGLRAGGPERLTVAGSLGLPQVICPGGAEHLGLFVEANQVPEAYANHQHVFHSPVIFVPRLDADEFVQVAESMCQRLQSTTGNAVMMLPLRGVGRYSIAGGPLHDPESDAAFFGALKAGLPESVEVVEVDADAEDPEFVRQCVRRLVGLIEGG